MSLKKYRTKPTDKKICVTFAGAIGTSKTPIANYLSTKLSLPVFSSDAIRSEVIEDLGTLDAKEYIRRRNLRFEEIIKNGNSFICDASVDRTWKDLKKQLISTNYDFFIISLDLSRDLLLKLYKAKGYVETLGQIDRLVQEHEVFLNQYSNDIGLHITDKDFRERIDISYNKVWEYLERRNLGCSNNKV